MNLIDAFWAWRARVALRGLRRTADALAEAREHVERLRGGPVLTTYIDEALVDQGRIVPEPCPPGAYRFRNRPPEDVRCVVCWRELFDDDFIRPHPTGGLQHHDCPQVPEPTSR